MSTASIFPGMSRGKVSSDFFESHEGTAGNLRNRWYARAKRRIPDFVCDAKIRLGSGLCRARAASVGQSARVLIAGIEVPTRAADIHDTVAKLRLGSHHDISVSIVPMSNRGKFANLDAAIASAPAPIDSFDWLVLVDDDITFDAGFLDDMIAIASSADLALSQPSHRFLSHATYSITQRRYGALARRTHFVEIGPLTLIRADLFKALLPFPPSRWCYGIDLVWSVAVRRAKRRMGIIDGTPVQHLRPVANSYDIDAAREEGKKLIRAHGVTDSRSELFEVDETVLPA